MHLDFDTILKRAEELYATEKLGRPDSGTKLKIQSDQVKCVLRALVEALNQPPPKQFSVSLNPQDGEYHNYFAYGSFEKTLENARFIQRFDLAQDKCVLVFEELNNSTSTYP